MVVTFGLEGAECSLALFIRKLDRRTVLRGKKIVLPSFNWYDIFVIRYDVYSYIFSYD